MNSIYFGKIGDGKSYHVVVNELLPAVKKQRHIITNIDGLNVREIALYLGMTEALIDIDYHREDQWYRDNMTLAAEDKDGTSLKFPPGSLIIVDEAQRIWDSRDFKATTKGFLNLLEYQRHFGLDFVFITQNVKRMDANISRLCNDSFDVKNLGMLGSILKKKYIVNRRQTPFDTDVIAQYSGKYEAAIFRLYRSAYVKSVGRSSAGFFSRPVFKFAVVFVFIAVLLIAKDGVFPFIPKAKKKVTVSSEKKGGISNGLVYSGVVAGRGPVGPVSSSPVSPVAAVAVSVPNEVPIKHEVPIKNDVAPLSLANIEDRCDYVGGGEVYCAGDRITFSEYSCEGHLYKITGGTLKRVARRSLPGVPFTGPATKERPSHEDPPVISKMDSMAQGEL